MIRWLRLYWIAFRCFWLGHDWRDRISEDWNIPPLDPPAEYKTSMCKRCLLHSDSRPYLKGMFKDNWNE